MKTVRDLCIRVFGVLGFALSCPGVAMAGRRAGETAMDAAIRGFVGNLGIGIILMIFFLVYNFFKRK